MISNERIPRTEDGQKEKESSEVNFFGTANEHLKFMVLELEKKQRRWIYIACIAFVIATALSYLIYNEYLIPDGANLNNANNWVVRLISFFKGLILVGIPITIGTFALRNYQSYEHEILKRGERKHAINFGEFYLNRFYEKANELSPQEIMEIFQWNISNETAFNKKERIEIDNKSLDLIGKLSDSLHKLGDRILNTFELSKEK